VTPEEKLEALGIGLPRAARPVANYIPSKAADGIIYVSGQIPVSAGELVFKGVVGRDVTLHEAQQAARLVAINILAAVKAVAGELSRVEALRLEGFVAGIDGFTEQASVLNGASDLLVEVLGEAGRHTRFAVGVPRLPLDAPVEIAAIFRIVE